MFVSFLRMNYNRYNNCHSNKEVIYHEEKCSALTNNQHSDFYDRCWYFLL